MKLPTLYQEFIHISKYAKWRPDDLRRETLEETVDRYIDFMCDEQCNGLIPDDVRKELRDGILNFDVLPSMRALMTAGPALKRDHVAGFNPVTGDTRVVTREFGNVPISTIAGKSASVLNKDGRWVPATFRSYGVQPIYTVSLRRNSNSIVKVQCTANHRWVLEGGDVLSTDRLRGGDRIPHVHAPKPETDADYALGVIHGIVYGDGTAVRAAGRVKGYHVRLCKQSSELLCWFEGYPVTYPPSTDGDPIVMLYSDFAATHDLKALPAATETESYLLGFVRGWIAADGSVSSTGQTTLCLNSSGVQWLETHGERLGFIVQHVTPQRSTTNFGDRKNPTFVLHIHRDGLVQDDFLCSWKQRNFRPLKSHYVVHEVVAESDTVAEVFCAEVPDTNTFTLAGGVVTGNCSFVAINDVAVFDEIMYVLMCGTGVGFSVERQNIANLPTIPDTLRKSKSIIKVEDSRIGWANALRELISMLYQGRIPEWDVSEVRPAGAKLVTFGGRASGPAPLESLFRFCISTFKNAAGRKLNSLECHDIVCKIGEAVVVGGVRRSACISLSNLSDDRMRSAKSGEWYRTTPWRRIANNSVAYTEKPGMDVFFKEWLSLYESKSGERGIFNREAAKKHLQKSGRRDVNHDFGVNPCVTADTWVMTDAGARQVCDLIDTPFTALIQGEAYPSTEAGFFHTGTKPVYRVETTEGYSITATADHLIGTGGTARFKWKPVGELQPGDTLCLQPHVDAQWGDPETAERDEKLGWLLGELVGDGTFSTPPRAGSKPQAHLRFWGPGAEEMAGYAYLLLVDVFQGEQRGRPAYNKICKYWQVTSTPLATVAAEYGIVSREKAVTAAIERGSRALYVGFIRGMFDADGTVGGTQKKGVSVRLSQSDLPRLHAIQRMLLRLGVVSRIYTDRHPGRHEQLLPDGRGGSKMYPVKVTNDLVIANVNIQRFFQYIGFKEREKQVKLCTALVRYARTMNRARTTAKVASVTFAGERDVYDCTVPDKGAFDANGIYVHNCGEIVLRPNGLCNLSEVVIRQDDTLETVRNKVRLATILGTMQATLTSFRYLRPIWTKNAVEEALLGVSMTGVMDHPLFGGRLGKQVLKAALEELRDYAISVNQEWAERLGINPAAAVTCQKPSGTVSQLVDCASGGHTRWSPYYIRTVRGANTDPVTRLLIDSGVPHEPDGTALDSTTVFSFPVKSPEGAVTRDDISALDQLELWKIYHDCWCEHNPSITVYVKDHQWMEVGAWVYKHFDSISGLAFLPYSDHCYAQAPYQEITQEEYETAVKQLPSVDWKRLAEFEQDDAAVTSSHEMACTGGACDIVDVGVTNEGTT